MYSVRSHLLRTDIPVYFSKIYSRYRANLNWLILYLPTVKKGNYE